MIAKDRLDIRDRITNQLGDLLLFNITHVAHMFARKSNRELAKSKFSLQVEQLPILFMIHFQGQEPLSQQDIANLLQKDKSGIQRSLRTLEREGYLRILPDETDRRKNFVQLTPAGKYIIEQVGTIAKSINEEITQQLSAEEMSTLLSIMRKISSVLDES